MAKEQAKIEIDTGLDLSGFEKGYSELNKELIKAQNDIAREAGKVTAIVEKEAQEQIEKIRRAEHEKITSIMTLYKLWIKPFKFNSCVLC